MKAYVTTYCISGMGDQYAGILSSYATFLYLQSLGYDTYLNFNGSNYHYFLLHKVGSLDTLYDLSPFHGKVLYNKDADIEKECVRLPQQQNGFKIYVSEIIDELRTYEAQIYNFHNFACNDSLILPNFTNQFLQKEVLQIKDQFLQGREKFTWLQVRLNDSLKDSTVTELYNKDPTIKLVNEYLSQNDKCSIMISSNNPHVPVYFSEKYQNTFHNTFTYDFGNHYLDTTKPIDQLIRNTQEIAAEMAMISHADRIVRAGWSVSSFLSYGVMHNIHHVNWDDRKRYLCNHSL